MACTVDGCSKPARSSKSALCAMHYHRQYRHGDLRTANESSITASAGRRYRRLYRPGHPLADMSGVVYAHRLALYELIGEGAQACHWCGKTIAWLDPDAYLQVDHLNGVGDDNRPENLVPSCGPCNSARASTLRAQALAAAGWFSVHDTPAPYRKHAISKEQYA